MINGISESNLNPCTIFMIKNITNPVRQVAALKTFHERQYQLEDSAPLYINRTLWAIQRKNMNNGILSHWKPSEFVQSQYDRNLRNISKMIARHIQKFSSKRLSIHEQNAIIIELRTRI